MDLPPSMVNLDYLPLGEGVSPAHPTPSLKQTKATPDIDWTQNLEGMGSSNPSLYDGLYNGLFQDQISQSRLELDVATLTNPQDWLDQEWPVSAIDLSAKGLAPQSVLSTSEESITSGGEEFSGCGSNSGSTSSGHIDHPDIGSKAFRGITMPTFAEDEIDSDGFISRI